MAKFKNRPARVRQQQMFSEPTRSQQQFKQDTDINHIVARHKVTGMMPRGNAGRQPIFGDFSSALDYQAQLDKVADVDQQFASLPARLRKRFQNSPYQLIRWVNDPENFDEAVELGLLQDPHARVPFSAGVPTPGPDDNPFEEEDDDVEAAAKPPKGAKAPKASSDEGDAKKGSKSP